MYSFNDTLYLVENLGLRQSTRQYFTKCILNVERHNALINHTNYKWHQSHYSKEVDQLNGDTKCTAKAQLSICSTFASTIHCT